MIRDRAFAGKFPGLLARFMGDVPQKSFLCALFSWPQVLAAGDGESPFLNSFAQNIIVLNILEDAIDPLKPHPSAAPLSG